MSLHSLSPLDGRYAETAATPLSPYFSEAAFILFRANMELTYLAELLHTLNKPVPSGLKVCQDILKEDREHFVKRVKIIEHETHHDVKAIEYALGEWLEQQGVPELKHWLHWGLTSEDVNNLAYGQMLSQAMTQVILPAWVDLLSLMAVFIKKTQKKAILARTHGQPASPSTVGKEFSVFAHRWIQELHDLKQHLPIAGKLNGATGNWHVPSLFFPAIDWLAFSKRVVTALGLQFEPFSIQTVPKESYARLFDSLRRLNNIAIDCSRNCWLYISMGYFGLQRSDNEVGSSTMPHKVNPIHFENAEGNFEMANAQLAFLSDKLLKTRLQRDLSDSTVLRNIGVTLGYSLLAIKSLTRGMGQLQCRDDKLMADLEQHWEVLAEPLQHALRLKGEAIPYDRLRLATQGHQFGRTDFMNLCHDLDLTLPIHHPSEYTGLATMLTDQVLTELFDFLAAQ